jgi:hypothetical protein
VRRADQPQPNADSNQGGEGEVVQERVINVEVTQSLAGWRRGQRFGTSLRPCRNMRRRASRESSEVSLTAVIIFMTRLFSESDRGLADDRRN